MAGCLHRQMKGMPQPEGTDGLWICMKSSQVWPFRGGGQDGKAGTGEDPDRHRTPHLSVCQVCALLEVVFLSLQ